MDDMGMSMAVLSMSAVRTWHDDPGGKGLPSSCTMAFSETVLTASSSVQLTK